MATNTTTIKFTGQFDTSQITKGLQDIKKQMSNTHIGQDLQKQLETALNKVEVNIPALEKMSAKGEFNFKELQNYQKILVEVSKDMNNLINLASKADFTKAFSSADTEKLKQFEKQLSDVENKIKSTKKEIIKSFEESEKSNGKGGNRTLNSVIEQLISVPPDQMKDKLDSIIKEAEKQTYNAREELQNIFKDAKYAHGGDNAVEFLFGKDSGVTIADKKKTEIKETFNSIRKDIQAFNENTPTKNVEETLKRLIELVNSDSLLNTEGKESVLKNLLPQDVLERLKELANNVPELQKILGKENLKILDEQEAEKIKITSEQVKFLEDRLKQLVNAKKITIEQANLITQSLDKQETEVKELGDQYKKQQAQTEALNATFGGLAHRIESSISALAVFNKSMQIIRNAIRSVEDLDAAFTQIAIVSEQSSESAWKMFDSFNKLAKQYSITTKDLAEGAKLFYQQGLNAADTMKMVEASTVSAALGEVTMTEAANTLTAAIQGYNESAAVAMDYTDKIAMVGAVSAADFNELSAAMEKTASSAYTAGIDFDHLLGYLGKMIEVTREAPANLGTAMKTIIARFEDMKKDPLAILEDGVTANKVEAALATIGIALRDTAGEFRPLQDVFDELGMKWQSLTRNQQAYIATVAAGSRQQSRFLAMMNNYDRTLDLIAESQESAGAAARQYETYQDSIAAAQARLTASWENFYSKIVDNSAIKIAINGLSTLVDALSKVPPAITAIGAAFGALELQGFIRGNGKNLLNNIFGQFVTRNDGTIEQVGQDIVHKIFNGITNALKDKSFEDFKEITDLSKSFPKMGENIEKGLGKVPGALSKVGSSFASVGKLIAGFVAANWQLIAVAAAVGAAIYFINKALNANKKRYEESINAIKKYNQEASDLKEKTSNAESLFDTYDDLISKMNRTTEEQKELNSTIDEISEIYPNAITYVDEYGNKHLENSNILKEEIALEKDLMKEKQRAALQERDTLLNGDRKNWKKEDFTDIGFSNAQVEAYFANNENLQILKERQQNYSNANLNVGNKNELKYELEVWNKEIIPNYQKIFDELDLLNTTNFLNIEDFNLDPTNAEQILDYAEKIIDSVDGLPFTLEDVKKEIEEIDIQSEKTLNDKKIEKIKYYNTLIDDYGLSLQKLSEDGSVSDEQILSLYDAITSYDFDKEVQKLEKIQEDLVEHLQRDNKLKLSFLDLVYSEKAGTATAQRAISSQLQSYISSLSSEAYSVLEKSFDEDGLTGFMQNAITKVNSDNAIEYKNLLQKVFDLSTSKEELGKIYEELGKYCNEEFINGLRNSREQQQKQIRENVVETLQSMGINTNNISEDLTTSQASALIRSGTLLNKEGYNGYEGEIYTEAIAPYIEQIEKAKSQAINLGIYEEFDKEVNDIVNKAEEIFGPDSIITRIIKSAVEEDTDIVKEAVQNKLFDDLQTQLQDFAVNAKKSMESILNGEYTKMSDTNLTSSDNGIFVDPDTGDLMVSMSKTLLNLERERSVYSSKIKTTYKEVTSELTHLENKQKELLEKDENLTYEDQKRLEQLENQKRILEQQNVYLEKMKSNGEQLGWATSIDLAKEYQSNLQSIQSIQETIKEQGFLDVSDMDTILNLMPQYAQYFTEVGDTIAGVEGKIYTITEENIENIMKAEKAKYDYKLAIQQKEAVDEYNAALADYNRLIEMYGKEADADYQTTQEKITNRQDEVNATEESAKKSIDLYEQGATGELQIQADKDTQMIQMFVETLQTMGDDYEEFLRQLETGEVDLSGFIKGISSKAVESNIKIGVDWDFDPTSDPDKRKALIQAMVEEAKGRMDAAWQKIQSLKSIDVPGLEKLKKDLESSGKSAEDLEKGMKAVADAIEKCTDALEDLDDLLIEIKRDLNDITVDYNPFTDLFEAWEHEWDYYYNIKRLIAQIGTQGEFIENIISSDYASADQKLEAEHAKVGNLISKMAANDAYITALRAGMSQTGVELMKDFGEYYKIDPSTGQIYQTDKNLTQINDTINQRRQEIYDLQKLQNEKENDLALENAKLDALEEEKSAYEDILSTIDSQIDSLENNEDIIVNIDDLKNQKAELEAKINVTDESIESAKEKIRGMEDEIQEIDVKITLKDQEASQLENYVDKMEDKVSEYEEYWETLNATIAEQQEILQQLTEERNNYIETAISTQRQLYNAIVENYQDEINEKKKQYDYLKQLDQDYLRSIRDNISKERQIREDASKQRSYQQNQQRAMLLQMDTSGAFRSELASLNKEIEGQRQELYDDLVDKQVEALEKEIDKRHELYDKEVSALEERLAYMQENAVLLWESVNAIVAEGTDAMMAMLENTTEYINSNELERMNLRYDWEYNVKKTFEGTEEGVIATLNGLVAAGNEFIIDKYPEVGQAIDNYKLVFDDAKIAVENYTSGIKTGTYTMLLVFNDFMTKWNTATNNFTGYADNWSEIIANLIEQTEEHKAELEGYYDEEGIALSDLIGSIGDFDDKIQETSQQLYDDFIEERRKYRQELDDVVRQIQAEISAAITNAANAIQNAANSISFSAPQSGGGTSDGGGGSSYTPTQSENTGSSTGESEKKTRYKIQINAKAKDPFNNKETAINALLPGFNSEEEAINGANDYINKAVADWLNYLHSRGYATPDPIKIFRGTLKPITYKQGGFADFTGPAWLDGTKSQPEAVLNAKQTRLFTSMVSSLEKASNNSNINSALGSSYNIGDINTNINVEKLDNETDIDRVARQVENRIMKSIRNRVSIAVA